MARISYEEAQNNGSSYSSERGSFEFFALRNDGDKAAVRILYDSPKDFIIYTIHDEVIENRNRKIGCLRSPKGNSSECPLCAAGKRSRNIFLIPMIQYFQDESGNIFGSLVVWERSLSYAKKLAGMIDEYGPLSDAIMLIKRNGAAGDIHTTYDILLGSPNVYRDDVYYKDEEILSVAKDEHLFDGLIISRPYEDVDCYVKTGRFPVKDDDEEGSTPSWEATNDTSVDVGGPKPSLRKSPSAYPESKVDKPIQSQVESKRPIRYY